MILLLTIIFPLPLLSLLLSNKVEGKEEFQGNEVEKGEKEKLTEIGEKVKPQYIVFYHMTEVLSLQALQDERLKTTEGSV